MAFNIMDLFGGDINKILTATQMAMRSTDLGRGGVVRADVDASGAMKFIIDATGESFDDPQSAFVEASTKMITQYERILPSTGRIGDVTNNPRRAQMGAILQSMQDRFNQLKAGGDRAFLDFLSRSGITDDSLSLGLISSQESRGANISTGLERLERSIGGFIPFIDDEGVDILQLMIGGKSLKKSDMFTLMSFLGNDVASLNKITEAFGLDGSSEKIESYLSKLGKRVRGVTADRDLTLMGEDITHIFKSKNKFGENISVKASLIADAERDLAAGRITSDVYDDIVRRNAVGSLEDNFGVVIEEGLDTFRKAFRQQARGRSLRSTSGAIGKPTNVTHISILMSDRDEKLIIESGLRSAGYGGTYDDYLQELERAGVSDIIASSETNEELLDRAERSLTDDQYKVFKTVMGAAEKEWDGARST
jgi:hypothetical protein